jgi:nucleoside-diphosphate-sugar epimerase
MNHSTNIVGNGLIANAFINFKINNYKIFASGVSDSTCVNEDYFDREFKLLKKTIKESRIVYFSTCSVYDLTKINTRYVIHKKSVENYILKKCKESLIIRLPQVIGNQGNPKNLVNMFSSFIKEGKKITIETKTFRNIIDVDLLPILVTELLNKNCCGVINLAAPKSINVLELAKMISIIIGANLKFTPSDMNSSYEIPLEKTFKYLPNYDRYFSEKYYNEVLYKYIK